MINKLIFCFCISFLTYITFLLRREKYLAIVWFVFFIVAMGFNYDNPDYLNYENSFKDSESEGIGSQYIWSLLKLLAFSCGATYSQFVFFMTVLGFFVFANALLIIRKKVSFNLNIFCLLYFIYPFLLDVIQIRNYLAMCFVFLAFALIYKGDRWSYLGAVLSLIISIGFHTAAIVYLPILLLNKIEKRQITRKVGIVIALLLLFLSFSPTLLQSTVGNLLTNFGDFMENRTYYLDGMKTDNGYLIAWLITGGNIIISGLILKKAG